MKNANVQNKVLSTIGVDRSQYRAATLEQKESRLKSGSHNNIDHIASAKAFHVIYNYENHKPIPETDPRKSDAWVIIQNAHHYGYDDAEEKTREATNHLTKSASTINEVPPWKIYKDYTANKSQYQVDINQSNTKGASTPSNNNNESKVPAWLLTKRHLFEGYKGVIE